MDEDEFHRREPSGSARRDRRKQSPFRGHEVRDGVLAGHYRAGRVYRPPFLAMDEFRLQDWVRDDLPDLLWPVVLVATHENGAARFFGRMMTTARGVVGEDEAVTIDGRLTSIERIPSDQRDRLVELFKALPYRDELVPREFVAVMRYYRPAPGAWLLDEPWDATTDEEVSQAPTTLAHSIFKVVSDGHLTALVKFMQFAWGVVSRRISFDQRIVDLLSDYPSNPAKFPEADSVIRASFGSYRAAALEAREDTTQVEAWALHFWRHNWATTACIPAEDAEAEQEGDPADDDSSGLPSEDADLDTVFADRSQEAFEATVHRFNQFLGFALDPALPVDLHTPERHEVVTGLASRAARAVVALAQVPDMWNGEQGSGVSRLLAETEILLRWMQLQDEGVFERYQSYGLGKQKLMKLHLQALVRESPELADQVAKDMQRLEDRTGGEHGESFQEVNLDATFSGRSVRQMAQEAGEEELYRHVYQTASGVTHGEWWAIEDYCMQRCLNPLHRLHLIPSFEANAPATLDFGRYLVGRLDQVLQVAEDMLIAAEE